MQTNVYTNSLMILMLIGALFYYKKSIFSKEQVNKNGYLILWAVLTIFSVFYQPESGDSASTIDLYNNYIHGNVEYHLEPFYFRLMDILPESYYLWRFVIWGSASLFTILALKKLNVNVNFATIVFITTCLIPFYYYVRNILGLSMLAYALSILLTHESIRAIKMKELLICLCLLAGAYFTHSSMPLYFAITIVAYFIPANRKSLIAIVVILIALSFFVKEITMFLISSGFYMDYATDVASKAFDNDSGFEHNLNGLILRYFWLLPYGLMILWGIRNNILASISDKQSKTVTVFMMISFILFFGTFTLAGDITYSLYYRLLNSSFYFISFYVTLFLYNNRNSIMGKVCMTLILLYNIYQYYALI